MMKNGLSLLLQKGLVPSKVQRLVSDVVGVSDFSSSVALMGSRRFFHTGGIATESLVVKRMYHVGVSSAATLMGARRFFSTGGGITQSLVKRDMFRVGGNLYQCNKSHVLPNFVRSLAFSSASQSPGQTPKQEPKKEDKKCQIIRNSQLQRERSCDDISSTQVKLNQFPGLMVHGMVENSKTRRLLRLNPDTGYFEQEQDVAAAANHDHSHHNELQVPHGHVCRGSAYGWLFLTDDNLDMKLLNPFSGAEIQLPPVAKLPPSQEKKEKDRWSLSKWFVYKAVWSANPSVEPRPVVFIIYGGQHVPRLAFCKPGDEAWTPLKSPIQMGWHMDAIYHKDQFYMLSYPGNVVAFDIGRRIDDNDLSVKTTVVATARSGVVYTRAWHLVVLDGELIRFELRRACNGDCCSDETKERMEKERKRDGDTTDEDYTDANTDKEYDFNYADADEDTDTETDFSDSDSDSEDHNDENDNDDDNDNERRPISHHPYLTYGIKIRRFDESEKQWVKVESLGDKAVFLGYNTSFALSASDYPHCIPNSIYFTYGCSGALGSTDRNWYDMGIYNVKDKSIKSLYPTLDDFQLKKPAPIWIVSPVDL